MDNSGDRARHGTPLTRAVEHVTDWLGSFPAIAGSVLLVVSWLIGVVFVQDHFGNDTYQLLINTATTIITFLMVFIIQNTQNRSGRALQTKIDAQTEALEAILARLGIEEDSPLGELVGVEDEPEGTIRREQAEVRRSEKATRQSGNDQ
jgi:low affinity Fe/Cu permease